MDLVSSFSGETVPTVLAGTGTYTVGILKIVTASHSNKTANGDPLKLVLSNLTMNLEKFGSTTFSGFTIQKINGQNSAATTFPATSATASSTNHTSSTLVLAGASTTANLNEDAKIDAGATAYFVVKGTVDGLLATTSLGVIDFYQLNIERLGTRGDGGDGANAIDWLDGYLTATGVTNTDFDYLNLDKTRITGIKVAES